VISVQKKWSEIVILTILSPVRLPFRHTGGRLFAIACANSNGRQNHRCCCHLYEYRSCQAAAKTVLLRRVQQSPPANFAKVREGRKPRICAQCFRTGIFTRNSRWKIQPEKSLLAWGGITSGNCVVPIA